MGFFLLHTLFSLLVVSLGFVRRLNTVVEGGEVEVCVRITSLPNSTLPEGIDVFLSTADGSAGFYTVDFC